MSPTSKSVINIHKSSPTLSLLHHDVTNITVTDNGFDDDADKHGQFCPNRFEMGQLLTHVQDTISILACEIA